MIELLALAIILSIVLLAWLRGRTDPEKARDARFESVFLVLSTFLGVFGALYFNSWHAERQALAQLSNMASAAVTEAKTSLVVVSSISKVDRDLEATTPPSIRGAMPGSWPGPSVHRNQREMSNRAGIRTVRCPGAEEAVLA